MARFLRPCCFCITNDITCTPECVSAPFFPTHMVNETEQVTAIFNLHYILTTLNNLRAFHPQRYAIIFKEAAFRYANALQGNHGRFKALYNHARQLENRVVVQEAEIQQLRLALNNVGGPQPQLLPLFD